MIGLRKFLVAVVAITAVAGMSMFDASDAALYTLGGIVSVYFSGQSFVDRIVKKSGGG